MRACYIKELTIEDFYQLKGDVAHHLINVVRIEKDEEILLLNGNGLLVKTKVDSVGKRELTLTTSSIEEKKLSRTYDLALGIPKKEALELSLKQAVELGFRKIFLVRSAYSQIKIPEINRLENLLVSALEQSNAPFMPEIVSADWETIPVSDYSQVLLMDSQSKKQHSPLNSDTPSLLVVGPEGGFAPEELSLMHDWANVKIYSLPTPILRTPTAVATGAGILLGRLLD